MLTAVAVLRRLNWEVLQALVNGRDMNSSMAQKDQNKSEMWDEKEWSCSQEANRQPGANPQQQLRGKSRASPAGGRLEPCEGGGLGRRGPSRPTSEPRVRKPGGWRATGGGRSSVSCKGGQHYSETVAFSVGHLKKQHRPSRGDPRRW